MLRVLSGVDTLMDGTDFIVTSRGNVYVLWPDNTQELAKLGRGVLRRIKALCTPGTLTVVTWDWFASHVEHVPA